MNKILAIAGLRNSGKSTISNMVAFLLNSPKFMHNYWCYNNIQAPYRR